MTPPASLAEVSSACTMHLVTRRFVLVALVGTVVTAALAGIPTELIPMTYFAPVQPLLGAAAILLAGWALRVRLRAIARGCALPAAQTTSA